MSKGRILVVDDNADVRKSVRMTLTKAGYEVIEAEDGEKGMEAINSRDNPLMVGIILCDIDTPRVNGLEAIAFFRSEFPWIPIVVMTGNLDVVGVSQLMKNELVDYLPKPVSPKKLTEIVGKARSGHGDRDPFKT